MPSCSRSSPALGSYRRLSRRPKDRRCAAASAAGRPAGSRRALCQNGAVLRECAHTGTSLGSLDVSGHGADRDVARARMERSAALSDRTRPAGQTLTSPRSSAARGRAERSLPTAQPSRGPTQCNALPLQPRCRPCMSVHPAGSRPASFFFDNAKFAPPRRGPRSSLNFLSTPREVDSAQDRRGQAQRRKRRNERKAGDAFWSLQVLARLWLPWSVKLSIYGCLIKGKKLWSTHLATAPSKQCNIQASSFFGNFRNNTGACSVPSE